MEDEQQDSSRARGASTSQAHQGTVCVGDAGLAGRGLARQWGSSAPSLLAPAAQVVKCRRRGLSSQGQWLRSPRLLSPTTKHKPAARANLTSRMCKVPAASQRTEGQSRLPYPRGGAQGLRATQLGLCWAPGGAEEEGHTQVEGPGQTRLPGTEMRSSGRGPSRAPGQWKLGDVAGAN